MEIVSPAMAEKLLQSLSAGASNVNQEFSDIINQFINYLIFLEVMSLLKWMLLFVGGAIVARAYNFWLLSETNEAAKLTIKGWRNLVVGIITLLATFISFNSAVGLGKIVLAPKIYVLEMAIEKIKEVRASAAKPEDKSVGVTK